MSSYDCCHPGCFATSCYVAKDNVPPWSNLCQACFEALPEEGKMHYARQETEEERAKRHALALKKDLDRSSAGKAVGVWSIDVNSKYPRSMLHLPRVERFILGLGTAILPPSDHPQLRPAIVTRETWTEFRSQSQVPMRALRELLATSLASGVDAIRIREDFLPFYSVGQYVHLAASLRKGFHDPGWLAAALLVASDDADLYPSFTPQGLAMPRAVRRTRVRILPLEQRDCPSSSRDSAHAVMMKATTESAFRGSRLVVECDDPLNVDVLDFLIGNSMQFAGMGAVSAALLSPANSPETTQDTLMRGQRAVVRLCNRSYKTIHVKVTLEGQQIVGAGP